MRATESFDMFFSSYIMLAFFFIDSGNIKFALKTISFVDRISIMSKRKCCGLSINKKVRRLRPAKCLNFQQMFMSHENVTKCRQFSRGVWKIMEIDFHSTRRLESFSFHTQRLQTFCVYKTNDSPFYDLIRHRRRNSSFFLGMLNRWGPIKQTTIPQNRKKPLKYHKKLTPEKKRVVIKS